MIATALLLATLGAVPAVQSLGPPVKGPVRRVVTLAPSLTDTVLALGEGELLVGVSRFDDRKEVAKLPRVGGYVDPSVEAVLRLKPDLVLVQPSPGNQKPVEKMAQLGTPILSLRMKSVQDVAAALRAVGRRLGVSERGVRLAQKLKATEADIRRRAAALPHPRVLFVYGFHPLVVAGPGSFADALLRDAGGINVAGKSDSPYPVYSVEAVLRNPPDVVIDDAGGAADPPLKRVLKNARWVKPSSQALLHPGPRLISGLQEIFHLIHHLSAEGPDSVTTSRKPSR